MRTTLTALQSHQPAACPQQSCAPRLPSITHLRMKATRATRRPGACLCVPAPLHGAPLRTPGGLGRHRGHQAQRGRGRTQRVAVVAELAHYAHAAVAAVAAATCAAASAQQQLRKCGVWAEARSSKTGAIVKTAGAGGEEVEGVGRGQAGAGGRGWGQGGQERPIAGAPCSSGSTGGKAGRHRRGSACRACEPVFVLHPDLRQGAGERRVGGARGISVCAGSCAGRGRRAAVTPAATAAITATGSAVGAGGQRQRRRGRGQR